MHVRSPATGDTARPVQSPNLRARSARARSAPGHARTTSTISFDRFVSVRRAARAADGEVVHGRLDPLVGTQGDDPHRDGDQRRHDGADEAQTHAHLARARREQAEDHCDEQAAPSDLHRSDDPVACGVGRPSDSACCDEATAHPTRPVSTPIVPATATFSTPSARASRTVVTTAGSRPACTNLDPAFDPIPAR